MQVPGFTLPEGAAFLKKRGISAGLSNGLPRLSEVCGGHPLLLNLSASWLKETAQSRLNEDDLIFFERLFQRELRNPEAQVGEIFELLLNELPAQLRALLLAVSVYRMPFDLGQAQAMQPEVMAAGLESLEAQGFLLGQGVWWQLHPLVKQLVIKALRVDGLEEEAHRKAIEYFEDQLQSETTDLQDYLECFHHYCECQNCEAAFDVVDCCYAWLNLKSYYRILLEIYERLAIAWLSNPALEAESQEKNGKTLNRLGFVHHSLGDYGKSISFQQQSLTISRKLGDRNGEASSLCGLGDAHTSLGKYDKAIDFYYQSLAIAREMGDLNGEAASLGNLGIVYDLLGEYDKAINSQQQSLAIQRELGDRNGEANSLCGLGNVYSSLGEYDKVIDFQQQSLAIRRELEDRNGEAASLCNLGNAYLSLREYSKAINFQQHSLAIQREIGDRNGEAKSLGGLGNVYSSLGKYDKVIDFQQQSLAIQREIGDRNGEASALGNLGIAYGFLGEYGKAIDFQQQSLVIQRKIGDRNGEANSLGNLGLTYAKTDEHWKARESYEQAKALFTELKLAHRVDQCEQAIQERNRIIARTPAQAPPLPTKATEPDWWAKSMPTATPTRSTAPTTNRQSSPLKWFPYLALAATITLIILLLQ